ncbi:MarR family winged helix-turn-helix transcriptional regulator [Hydrogenophaga palleronii]|uniref:MarR family winged helix-turn-helix transcriptional regulator n=1 Tax=Hydrogenophaga palleronii TaxID=65655 RepID=UPI0008267D4E|nr:MarR family transcriptional regulator [Hydrogenophaga palleronii]
MRKSPSLDRTPAGSMLESQLKTVLGYQLAQAAVVTNAIFDETIRKPHEMRTLEYTVLALVCENPGVSPLRLASALAVTAPSITNMVDRLVARELVTREKSSKDGRQQYLHATRAGHKLKTRSTDAVTASERESIDTLTPGEYALLLELLHKLAGARKPGKRGSTSLPD